MRDSWFKNRRWRMGCGLVGLLALLGPACRAPAPVADAAAVPLDGIRLPPGFQISLFADQLPGARSLTRSPSGVIFVGTRAEGVVYAVRDRDGDGRADDRTIVARGLDLPNGVAYADTALYVAEMSRVIRFDDLEHRLDRPPAPVVVRADLPARRAHGWRYCKFGPDRRLYVAIGAPGNAVEERDPRFASICRMNADGSGFEVYARGIRNSVGFTWDGEGRLWFTDNGRDWLGDDLPPDELNCAPQAGLHFGYPHVYGDNQPDPAFKRRPGLPTPTPPAVALGAHVAALGITAYEGELFPAEYRGSFFIAEHGSWNRSRKSGYRITRVATGADGRLRASTFADGWMRDETVRGRPVDILALPDGSLLVSDDYAGAIYRITCHPPP